MTYVGLAFVLKTALKFEIRQFRLPDVVAFLLLIPAGAALSAFIYCGVLYLGAELSSDKVFLAMIHCLIGSALRIVTVIPATTAAFKYPLPPWRWSGYSLFTIFIFALGMGLGFAALATVFQKMQARNISHLIRMAFVARNLNSGEQTPQFASLSSEISSLPPAAIVALVQA